MNDIKPGWKTTEFWLTGVTVLIGALIGIFVVYGVLTKEQAEAWTQLLIAFAGLVIPVAIAWATIRYGQGRAELKKKVTKEG